MVIRIFLVLSASAKTTDNFSKYDCHIFVDHYKRCEMFYFFFCVGYISGNMVSKRKRQESIEDSSGSE